MARFRCDSRTRHIRIRKPNAPDNELRYTERISDRCPRHRHVVSGTCGSVRPGSGKLVRYRVQDISAHIRTRRPEASGLDEERQQQKSGTERRPANSSDVPQSGRARAHSEPSFNDVARGFRSSPSRDAIHLQRAGHSTMSRFRRIPQVISTLASSLDGRTLRQESSYHHGIERNSVDQPTFHSRRAF